MPTSDSAMNDRFNSQQRQVAQTKAVALNLLLQKSGKPNSVDASAFDKIPEWLKEANEGLYNYLAKSQDKKHLSALASEIEARFNHGTGGVLIRRITKRTADGAGNFLPSYVGLQVIGQGDTKLLAMLDYEDRLAAATETGRYAPVKTTVCTPQNPTGERLKATATLSAAPEGFNMGYAAAMAASISEVMKSNPENVGKIVIGGNAFPIQPKSFLEDEYLFISRDQWVSVKSLLP